MKVIIANLLNTKLIFTWKWLKTFQSKWTGSDAGGHIRTRPVYDSINLLRLIHPGSLFSYLFRGTCIMRAKSCHYELCNFILLSLQIFSEVFRSADWKVLTVGRSFAEIAGVEESFCVPFGPLSPSKIVSSLAKTALLVKPGAAVAHCPNSKSLLK